MGAWGQLASGPSGSTSMLSADEQTAAAAQWVTWWRRLLAHAVREAQLRRDAARNPDVRARLAEIASRQRQVFDPPDFESLETAPALRTAAVATFADGLKWSSRPKRSDPGTPSGGSFAWPEVRSAAESVAAERGVPIGDLAAAVHVLDVQGQWSFLAGSGCALCSTAVPADPATASLLLRDVFGSGVR